MSSSVTTHDAFSPGCAGTRATRASRTRPDRESVVSRGASASTAPRRNCRSGSSSRPASSVVERLPLGRVRRREEPARGLVERQEGPVVGEGHDAGADVGENRPDAPALLVEAPVRPEELLVRLHEMSAAPAQLGRHRVEGAGEGRDLVPPSTSTAASKSPAPIRRADAARAAIGRVTRRARRSPTQTDARRTRNASRRKRRTWIAASDERSAWSIAYAEVASESRRSGSRLGRRVVGPDDEDAVRGGQDASAPPGRRPAPARCGGRRPRAVASAIQSGPGSGRSWRGQRGELTASGVAPGGDARRHSTRSAPDSSRTVWRMEHGRVVRLHPREPRPQARAGPRLESPVAGADEVGHLAARPHGLLHGGREPLLDALLEEARRREDEQGDGEEREPDVRRDDADAETASRRRRAATRGTSRTALRTMTKRRMRIRRTTK